MSERKATITRSTEKSEVKVVLDLDGQGRGLVETGIPFLDEMLLLFTRQGSFNLEVQSGPGEADPCEIVEEVALCLGLALDKALGDKSRIARLGQCCAPVQEQLARAVAEISGHPCFVYRVRVSPSPGGFDSGLVEEFWRAFVSQAHITLHLELLYGDDGMPAFEAVFKAAARALSAACALSGKA